MWPVPSKALVRSGIENPRPCTDRSTPAVPLIEIGVSATALSAGPSCNPCTVTAPLNGGMSDPAISLPCPFTSPSNRRNARDFSLASCPITSAAIWRFLISTGVFRGSAIGKFAVLITGELILTMASFPAAFPVMVKSVFPTPNWKLIASMSIVSRSGPKVPSSFTGRLNGCTSDPNMYTWRLPKPH